MEEHRPGVAAMNAGRLAAAFEHGSNAAEVEHRFCALEQFTAGSESNQEEDSGSDLKYLIFLDGSDRCGPAVARGY